MRYASAAAGRPGIVLAPYAYGARLRSSSARQAHTKLQAANAFADRDCAMVRRSPGFAEFLRPRK